MDRLKSTTWKGRNSQKIAEITAYYDGQPRPLVLQVGIGGMTKALCDYYPQQQGMTFTPLQKIQRFPVKLADGLLRRLHLQGRLETFETYEILEHLACLQPRLLVMDISQKLLDALPATLQKKQADICRLESTFHDGVPIKADIVISYNTICRTKQPTLAQYHIENCVKEGGLLSVDASIRPNPLFERITDTLYRRLH